MDIPQGSSTKLGEVDSHIATLQLWLSSSPYSRQERHMNLMSLSIERLKRYNLLEQPEDIDKAILHLTEAVLLPLPPLPDSGVCTYVVFCFFQLARSLLARFHVTRQPEDLEYSIEYFRHFYHSDLRLDLIGVPRSQIIIELIEALGTHVELEVDSAAATRIIEEMVALCRELLISDILGDDLVDAIVILKDSFYTAVGSVPVDAIDQVVEYIREAIPRCPPGSHRASNALAEILALRSSMNSSIGDSQEAIALFDKIAASQPLGDKTNPSRSNARLWAAMVADSQFTSYPNLETLEEAMSRVRTALADSSLEDDPELTLYLEELMEARAKYFHLTEHSQMVSSGPAQGAAPSSLQHMSTPDEGSIGWDARRNVRRTCSMTTIERQIQLLPDLISSALPGTADHGNYLRALADWYDAKFERTDDTTYLEKSIDWRKIALASTPDVLICIHLNELALALLLAYHRNHGISFLEESISFSRHVLNLPGTQGWNHTIGLQLLRQGLLARFRLLHHREDLDEAVLLLQMSIDHICTIPPDKLRDACTWVAIARVSGHPSVSTAYETAMSWLQTSLVFAPTLHTQHAHLLAIEEANKIPLEYASYQVQTGRLEEAIQTLERGRALLWSGMRGLRTSIDQLSSTHPALATKLTIVNQDLETLMTSIPPGSTGDIDEDVAPGEAGTDAFSNFLKKQRTLLNERDALTSQIQGLRGFENFLKMPSFDMLRAAASRGPIIIINHCSLRSDMILVLHNSPPSLIPTAEDFYHRANELADRLSDTRKKHVLESMQYKRALRYVLEELYELVGQPVIDKLHELNIPEQSRIWWCPTSVFCSLPLHAMGPIPSKDKVKRYFSDVYISSYTPTLSALIKSREPSVQTSDPVSLLFIAPPDTSLIGVGEEIEVIRRSLGSSIDSAVLEDATSETTIESLRHHRLAHFTCHGVLEEGKPFEASFILHGGSRLTLLDIVRSRLATAEFAFLSACHTAELTDGSIADEALHLTAAMQHLGFRSVVGTMWAMADTDGRDLAEHFYTSMFSGEDESLPYYELSAKALRDGVQKLRREKRVSLERWVNFVHYGA
ncbi:CHAT domain-containing protein [Lactifluus subvellereus]|nr:CHAT domain-containing protein [Lactifluus subvellereus]